MGSGRLALPLAARGVEVHGVDASEAMLERLRAKPGGDAIHLTHGDMAELALVDAAGVHGGVRRLQHAVQPRDRAEAQQRCMERVAGLLAPTGLFVVEAFVPADPSDGRSPPGRSRRVTSPPTRWCCR